MIKYIPNELDTLTWPEENSTIIVIHILTWPEHETVIPKYAWYANTARYHDTIKLF